jgi:hypothetical protein
VAPRRTTTDKGRYRYPDVVAGCILYVKQLYPPIHYREIARIVARRFGYKTNHVTVKRRGPSVSPDTALR